MADPALLAAVVACLYDTAQRAASRIVARAYASRQLGATAEACRSSALDLDRQAERAEKLLFSQASAAFRAAAADILLVADALEIIEARKTV